jgi:hypothetical protein
MKPPFKHRSRGDIDGCIRTFFFKSLVIESVGPPAVKSAGHRVRGAWKQGALECSKYNEDVICNMLGYFRSHGISFKKQSDILNRAGCARAEACDHCRAGGNLDTPVRSSGRREERPASILLFSHCL